MTSTLIRLVVVGVGAAPATVGWSQDRGAREVVDRALTAMGGKELLAGVRGWSGRGTVEVLGGYVGPYRVWRAAPNRMRTQWNIGVISHDLGFDGRDGWEKALTVRQLPPMDRERVARRAILTPLLSRSSSPMAVVSVTDTPAVRFTLPGGLDETVYFDPRSGLPVREVRKTRYEEGIVDLVVRYADWRQVGPIQLPHRIDEQLLELPLSIRIDEYRLEEALADSLFVNPNAGRFKEPLAVTLATIPKNIYKEHDGGEPKSWQRNWGIPFGPTESWLVNLVVRERLGRQVTPLSSKVEMFAGPRLVKTMDLAEPVLTAGQKYPVARFYPQDEIFHFRHHFTEHAELNVDRLRYTLRYRTPTGASAEATLDIPVTRYQTKTKLIAPIRGNLIAMTGHEFYELAHKYEWSQQFSWDFIGLGEDFELKRPGATGNAAWVTDGRELVAPGDGVVVYTRNDVPDMMAPKDYLKLTDPQWAIGGNSVIIDHGNGEVSCLFHMKLGTVRVKLGDRVKQGQVIGQIGSSGSPGVPHVHYQLQAEPKVFGADALPVQFTNLSRALWLGGATVVTPIRGVPLHAK